MAMTQTWNTAELVALDRRTCSTPSPTSTPCARDGPLVLARGEGVYLWDTDGNRYIDAFAGLWNVNVGHGRPRAGRGGRRADGRGRLRPELLRSRLPARRSSWPPSWPSSFPARSTTSSSPPAAPSRTRPRSRSPATTGGCKGKPEKVKILSRRMAYHGIAMGALAATGIPAYHEGFGPRAARLRPPHRRPTPTATARG